MLKPVPAIAAPAFEQIGFIAGIVAFCARRWGLTLAAGLTLTLAAGFYAAGHFAISTDLNKLISADLPWRQREIALGKAFPQRDNMILAVLDAPSPELATQAALDLQQALASQSQFFAGARSIEASDFFRREGLLFLPVKDVESRMEQLIEAQPFLGALAQDPSLRGLAGTLQLMARGGAEELAAPLGALAGAMERAASGEPDHFSWSALFSGAPASQQEKRRFLQVKPVLDFSALEPGADASEALRATATNIGLTPENGFNLRLTGDVPLQDEEFATLSEGAALHNGLMGLAVLFILWRALRWGRLIVAVTVNMLVGLVLTAAAGLFLVQALNPISIAFAILFVGIGVDFGIQFTVRYREERFHDDHLLPALDSAGKKASLPLALAAAATAAGFYAFMPTDYRGVSELGLIAGTGMILAFLTSVTLLPALLALFRPPAERAPVGYAFLAPVDRFQTRHRRAIVIAAVGLALLGTPLLTRLRFDFNPLHLRSAQVESMATLLDLMQDPRMSPNIIEILSPSLAAADALAARIRALPEVESVTGLTDFIPEDQAPKLAAIHEARGLIGPSLTPAKAPSDATDAEDARALAAAGATLSQSAGDNQALARIGAAMTQLAEAPEAARLRANKTLIAPMRALLADTLLALQAAPVTLADLPADLKSDWLALGGRARLEVAPRGDKNDNDNLRRFTAAVRKIAPDASGAAVSILESGDTVVRAFVQAGIMALVSISLLLYLALRRVGDVALTLAPLLLAGFYTMEICVLIDLPLNFANIIALPLLLGLGVAFKIYYVMAWRAGSAELLQTCLTRAIFFSAMTTATAFGSLWSSNHPGTSSMGKLLALSLATTLCAAVFFQPALMGPPRKPKE
jgi:hopanoid biosynthesis associated RND transporter like protein HpnN